MANDWKLRGVEGLIRDRIVDELKAGPGRIDDVGEREVLEVKGRSKIRQHDDQIIRCDGIARDHRLDIDRQRGILIDDFGVTDIERIQRPNGDFHVWRQWNV